MDRSSDGKDGDRAFISSLMFRFVHNKLHLGPKNSSFNSVFWVLNALMEIAAYLFSFLYETSSKAIIYN